MLGYVDLERVDGEPAECDRRTGTVLSFVPCPPAPLPPWPTYPFPRYPRVMEMRDSTQQNRGLA